MAPLGVARGLLFDLAWQTPRPVGSAAQGTLGSLHVSVGGRSVWEDSRNRRRGLEWTWVDLLEHLAKRWTDLVWEETDPLGLDVRPWEARAALTRWMARAHLSEEAADAKERALLRYEQAHNLAAALAGASVPPIWLIREGGEMLIAAGPQQRVVRRPFAEVRATLAALGEALANRLAPLSDARAQLACAAWAARRSTDATRIAAAATHLSREALEQIVGTPLTVIQKVLTGIRSVPPGATSALDGLADAAAAEQPTGKPHVQGKRVASWFRTIPGVADQDGQVDPQRVLAGLGVTIAEQDLGSHRVDAVACWGAGHGPAVLLNIVGTHAQARAGRRSTLAHELGHLLLDRRRALPVAEVMGGAAPPEAEQRANAFAAELLLPAEEAGRAFAKGRDPATAVRDLTKRFGSSKQIIAWQAIRSGWQLSSSTRAYLRNLLPDEEDRQRFDSAYNPP